MTQAGAGSGPIAAVMRDRRLVHALVAGVALSLLPAHFGAGHFSGAPSTPRVATAHVAALPANPEPKPGQGAAQGAALAPDSALTIRAPAGSGSSALDLDRASPEQLRQALDANKAEQARIHDHLAAASTRIETLNNQLGQLDAQIADVSSRIQLEQREARALARAIYAQPSSAALALAESESLGDFLTRSADLASANVRAREIAATLVADQKRLRDEQAKALIARDDQVVARKAIEARVAQLQAAEAREQELIAAWARQAALQARVAAAPADIVEIIRAAFAPLGQAAVTWALRIASCESNYHPNSVNSTSGAMGLFQFLPSTWAHCPYGATDPFDPKNNALAAAWLYQHSGAGQWVCQ